MVYHLLYLHVKSFNDLIHKDCSSVHYTSWVRLCNPFFNLALSWPKETSIQHLHKRLFWSAQYITVSCFHLSFFIMTVVAKWGAPHLVLSLKSEMFSFSLDWNIHVLVGDVLVLLLPTRHSIICKFFLS